MSYPNQSPPANSSSSASFSSTQRQSFPSEIPKGSANHPQGMAVPFTPLSLPSPVPALHYRPPPIPAYMAGHNGRDRSGSDATLVNGRDGLTPNDPSFVLPSYHRPYHGSVYPQGPYGFQHHHHPYQNAQFPPNRPYDEEYLEYKSPTSRGVAAQLADLRELKRHGSDDSFARSVSSSSSSSFGATGLKRLDSMESEADEYLEPDDPHVTGMKSRRYNEDDPEEVAKELLRRMNYKQRRKEKARIFIEFNITSMVNRQNFLLKLARALMTFGAPSHRVESQLLACARILEVDAEFIHIPGIIICSFGDAETKTSETHVVKCGGGLSLGNLHKVHQIYREVVHDEICAKTANQKLSELLRQKPIYSSAVQICFAFFLSVLICPLAFGGSFLDMWVAGTGAVVISFVRLAIASKHQLYASLFEITMAMLMSFVARALSSIRGEFFCYTAITSGAIVSILPGYLILRSSLELASKNIICGSINMVYALFYTLCLGFSLQMGSDFYLIFDRSARRSVDEMLALMATDVDLFGLFKFTGGDFDGLGVGNGSFSYVHNSRALKVHTVEGCYRMDTSPWYLRNFPPYTQFFIVPIFSVLSSFSNLQPWRSRELPVMVFISCVAYSANKIANHYIFSRSDIVSAIGAFVVGLLGNIYSRKMGGTAFTSMVTGVLFLVPSGLSQAGGMTAGNSVDIGGSMIAVTIGITVGLFMSQAVVYMFGSRKGAAVFSF